MANRTNHPKRDTATKPEKRWNKSNYGVATAPVLPSQTKATGLHPYADVGFKLRRIFSDILAVDEDAIFTFSLVEEELGADSLDIAEIEIAVEDAFGISIPLDFDPSGLETFNDWIKLVLNPPVAEPGEECVL